MKKSWKIVIWALALAGIIATGCTRRTTQEPTEESLREQTVSTESEPETEKSTISPTTEEAPTIVPFPQIDEEANVMENIIIGTDIHYLSPALTDGGERFQRMVENGDGKIVTYIDQITDAFLDEVIQLRPNALVLSGDLTLDGEKESHQELAKKLYRVEAAGVTVLVIPGNHDINNHLAGSFQGDARVPVEHTTPEDFREIYKDFGYDQAMSEDEASLSYVYKLDENCRLFMLDSCQYENYARVGGAIQNDTYEWIEKELEKAWEEDAVVVPVAHHNLLEESEIYVEDCTIEHGEQLAELLEGWDVSLFLSGHLHVQHAMQSEDGYGIQEIVTSSLATPQCQYGTLALYEDQSFLYRTSQVNVEQWAADNNRTEQELLNFNKFKEPFLRRVFYNQALGKLRRIQELTEDQKSRMAKVYEELNYSYYQGTAYTIADAMKTNPDYLLWEEYSALTELSDYVQYIVRDGVMDYNRVQQ